MSEPLDVGSRDLAAETEIKIVHSGETDIKQNDLVGFMTWMVWLNT